MNAEALARADEVQQFVSQRLEDAPRAEDVESLRADVSELHQSRSKLEDTIMETKKEYEASQDGLRSMLDSVRSQASSDVDAG